MRPRISDIITIACRLSGVPREEVISPARFLHLCAVRYAIYTTAREWGFSYSEIGRAVRRDHSTVLHGTQTRRRLEFYIEDFDEFCAEVSRWSDELPPFVIETNWQPPRVFAIRPSERIAAARRASSRQSTNPCDYDMEMRRATIAAMDQGSANLLSALRRAA